MSGTIGGRLSNSRGRVQPHTGGGISRAAANRIASLGRGIRRRSVGFAPRLARLALAPIVAAVAVASPASVAQDSDGRTGQDYQRAHEARLAREAERRRTESFLGAYERRRAAAHARMPDTMHASTPDPAARGPLSCPVVPGPAEDFRAFAPRVFRPASSPAPTATAPRRPFFVPAPARSRVGARPARVAGTTLTSPSSAARALAIHSGAAAFAAGAAADDSAAGTAAPALLRAPAIGDFNGDGNDDVLLRHGDGRWRYYAMDGRTHIAAESGMADIDADPAWVFAGAGDFNGDGKADVLLRHADGRWRYYAMDGRARIAGESGDAGLTTDAAWRVAGIGDFDGDGNDDVLLRHAGDMRWHFYPMDGREILDGGGNANLTRKAEWSVAGIGDLDGDGSDDVLLRKDNGAWYFYPMDGRRYISGRHGPARLTSKAEYALAGLGDFDGDGKDDALLRRDDGLWYFYPMDGREILDGRGVSNLTRNTEWSVAGIGDLDGDGRDDVLLRKKDTTGTWFYYPMDGGRRHAASGRGGANLTSDRSWKPAGDVAPVFRDCPACPQMIEVPAGAFAMGSPASEAGRSQDEGPAREVTLAEAFAIGVREVTYAEWEACVADGGCGGHLPSDWGWGGGGQPVMDVTWEQARSYAEWLAAKTGEAYRLPTEAEWEYAARAGTATPFHTGATISTEQANYDGSLPPYGAGAGGESRARTTAVGSFPANAFGLRDMHGNVAEWTLDCYAPDYRDAPAAGAAAESDNCAERVIRGGSWRDGPEALRSANRDRRGADAYSNALGFRVARGAPPGGSTTETAAEVFEASVSPVVQSKCVNCHVEGGASGNTPLVFVRDTDADHLAKNLREIRDYLANPEGGAERLLQKMQGALAHGGGVQVVAGTDEYRGFQRLLELLGAETGPVEITPATLFEGVKMEPWRSTLRRAAIVFAGRIPTDAEYAAIRGAAPDEFRAVIRGLMEGPEFHEFLIRGSNDRLLTDRDIVGRAIIPTNEAKFVAFTNLVHEEAARGVSGDDLYQYEQFFQYGFGRAPLELIAHVAENDLDYRDILTADYIMANPYAARGYGAPTVFDDPTDAHEFRPSEIVSYYRDDDSKRVEETEFGTRVLEPGNLATDYPHAGILNTTVFLLRYPTTATNRNRARSRWTYYHFLDVDIEKSESRTTDPVALADTNNPTMQNPACTGCHSVMDPVAGAFQNYGDIALYRDQPGGLDSLDDSYKEDRAVRLFEIGADAWAARQTMAVEAWMRKGHSRVFIGNPHNSWWDHESQQGGSYGRDIRLNDLVVRTSEGDLIQRFGVEEFNEHCEHDGEWNERSGEDDHWQFWGRGCEISADVPADGTYVIEAVAWADQAGDEVASFELGTAPLYREGDTWYRDMRSPGFDGELVPDADESLQWLAGQIVADDRFAEATVKFWWPTIMGAEVAEPPENEDDTDFEGRLLASNAQATEVKRLARGFRRGFGDGLPYNLKDLLVEIALSRWFRAQALTDDDPVRLTALRAAGARRLLTPEELARKTLALTGFQWGRTRAGTRPAYNERWSNLTDVDDGYGLLYGGIDSAGVTERSTDLTSVMAGVAQSHAMESGCPIVQREFYLVPEEDRLLFGGVDKSISPVWEFGDSFEVEAASQSAAETVSVRGSLTAGAAAVTLSFLNNEQPAEGEDGGDRNLRLDRLRIQDAAGGEIGSWELGETEAIERGCEHNGGAGDHYDFHCEGSLEIPVIIPADGSYVVEVTAWADQYGDEYAKLDIAVTSDTQRSVGSRSVKANLADLYGKLHGIEVTARSPEVVGAYDLFVDVWQRRREADANGFGWNIHCEWWSDHYYLDGIVEDAFVYREDWGDEWGARHDWDWERIETHFDTIDWSDRHGVADTWTAVLAYLLMDYRYLYL